MKKEFVVNRQGKDFVLYAGLLDQAHREGLKRISTRVVQAPTDDNGQLAIVHAEVETEKGVFSGIGDASPQNVGRMIAPHLTRMAETRAKARALRDAINVGTTALEELADIEEEIHHAAQPRTAQAGPATARPVRTLTALPRPEPAEMPAPLRAPVAAADRPRPTAAPAEVHVAQTTGPATEQQIARLTKLQTALGRPTEILGGLTQEAAAAQIAELVQLFNAQARQGRSAGAR